MRLALPQVRKLSTASKSGAPIIPALPPLTEEKITPHVQELDPSHPIGVPAAAVTAKPHAYWIIGTVSFGLFIKWLNDQFKGEKFTPGVETAEQKAARLAKLNVALKRIGEFQKWAHAQKKSGVYDEQKLTDALNLATSVQAELLDSQSVDVVIDNGRKRLPLAWRIGAGVGINMWDFLFLLPILPLGVLQWAFRKVEDTVCPPRLWTSDTSLALLGVQVQDPHVLMPAGVQTSWWQRQNYYRQRARRSGKFSGKHIHPSEYRGFVLIADDRDAPQPAPSHDNKEHSASH